MDGILKLKIESYISNSMSKKELELFEKELKINAALKKEVALAKELNHFLRDEYIDHKVFDKKLTKEIKTYLHSDDAKKTEARLLKVKNEYHAANKKSTSKNYYFVAASITVLCISIFSYFMLNQNTSEKLFTQYYSVNDLPSVVKRGDNNNNNNNDFENGVTAFKSLDYAKALGLFNTYNKTVTDLNPAVYLYAGIANMELENFDTAIVMFDKMINSNAIDKSKGLWFKALTYLKMKDKNNAIKTLKKITKKDFKFKEATNLLKKLN